MAKKPLKERDFILFKRKGSFPTHFLGMNVMYAFFLLFVLTFDLSRRQEGKNTWSDFVILVTFSGLPSLYVETDDSFYVQGGGSGKAA